MNKLKSLLAVFSISAMALFTFTHCTKEEQSELSLDSFEQFVTISGKVVYSTGVDTTSTDYTIEVMKPAAGRKVFVEVTYASYDPGAAGNKIFETETDEVGEFSIEVPTTPLGINATIRMEEFTDFYSEYVKMENGRPVFKTRLRRYQLQFPALPSSLKTGAFSFPEALTYGSTEIDMEGYDEKITLTGNVQLAYESSYRTGAYKPASSGTVELEIVYDPAGANPLTVVYGAATDANGNYSVTLPLKSYKDGFQIKEVSIKGIGQAAYTHYYEPNKTKSLSGAYATNKLAGFPINFTNITKDIPHSLGQQFLKFTPGHNDGLPQADFAPESWTDDLAGWEKYPGFNETLTVTGTCYMAAETGFAAGSYETGIQTVKLNVNYGGTLGAKTLFAATNPDGSFSIDLPAEKSTDVYAVALLAPEEKEFLHYKSAAESIKLSGAYNLYANIKKEAPKWYELGDHYYKFAPDAPQPATWHADLAGWVKKKDHNLKATVSGKVYLAKESAFATGRYVPAANKVIQIDVGTDSYQGMVSSDGTLSIDVLIENSSDELAVALGTGTINDVKDFEHYTKGGTTNIRTLKGDYTATQLKSASAKWNELGDIYYTFTPDAPPATWQQDLAGWQVRLDHKFSANITGTLRLPVEESFRVGSYRGAAYQIVKLVSNGFTLVGATNAEGDFSIPVPLQYADDEPGAAWHGDMATLKTTSFSHFRKPASGSTEILEGNYTFKLTNLPAGSPWNVLGTRYYDFAPDGAPTNWSNNLPGWVVVPNYSAVIMVKGKVKKAVQKREGVLWIAGWEVDRNRMVTVTVAGTPFDVVTSSNGDIVFVYPANNAPDNLTITITPDNDDTDVPFVHHPDVTKTNYVSIYGKFVSANNIAAKSIARDPSSSLYNVTESAKMLYSPVGSPDGWGSYDWASILDQE